MDYLDDDIIRDGFASEDLFIIRTKEVLLNFLTEHIEKNTVLLMMSSGNFGGLDYEILRNSIQIK
jgi:hypothetical protein